MKLLLNLVSILKNTRLFFYLLNVVFLLFSCKQDIKFNENGWKQKGDLNSYTKRESMIKDLTENYKLRGLSYSKLIDLLGVPENYSNQKSNTITYNIVSEFRNNIDPVYIKNLEIQLSKDSIVKNYKIIEISK
jgi:hypothetical protein